MPEYLVYGNTWFAVHVTDSPSEEDARVSALNELWKANINFFVQELEAEEVDGEGLD